MGLYKPRAVVQTTIAERLQQLMRGVLELFPGAKLTLVIRTDRLEDPLVITNDQQDEVIKAIRERMPGKPGLITAN